MKIIEKIREATEAGSVVFSFDFCTPNAVNEIDELLETMNQMTAHCNPSFCCIGANDISGSISAFTPDIADKMQNTLRIEAMMHLTCKDMAIEEIDRALSSIKANGAQNVLVFGGDRLGPDKFDPVEGVFACSLGLVKHIRAEYGDYFGIAVVAYPAEAHPEVNQSDDLAILEEYQNDLANLKRKVDAGAELIITLPFYDTDKLLKFTNDCRQIGIVCSIVPGVMPIKDYEGFMRITALSKTMNLGLVDGAKISRLLLHNRKRVKELPASQLPWLMLADNPNRAATCAFFSFVDNITYEVELPEAQEKHCVGSSEGWVITVDSNLEMGLLNPFSKVQIWLPPQPTFEYQEPERWLKTIEFRRDRLVRKVFLSESPSVGGNYVVIAIQSVRRRSSFFRSGFTRWTTIDCFGEFPVEDVIFYQGRFYAISICAVLLVCDLGPIPCLKEIISGPYQYNLSWKKYLVNTSETSLLVGRIMKFDHRKQVIVGFEVYGLVPDHCNGGLKWKKVTSLRRLALFIGRDPSMCLCADDYPVCIRNCIYFTDDNCDAIRTAAGGTGSDMGVFNFGEGTIQPLYHGLSRSVLWPPLLKPN